MQSASMSMSGRQIRSIVWRPAEVSSAMVLRRQLPPLLGRLTEPPAADLPAHS
jgi:hypothetical protein